MEVVAKSLVVDGVVKVYFYNKETDERLPLWDKDKPNLRQLFGQEKLDLLVNKLLEFKSSLEPEDSEENLVKLTEEANSLVKVYFV